MCIRDRLYGDWTYEQAQTWLDAGISQAIYHQSRDALLAGETWGEKDLNKVKKLIEIDVYKRQPIQRWP